MKPGLPRRNHENERLCRTPPIDNALRLCDTGPRRRLKGASSSSLPELRRSRPPDPGSSVRIACLVLPPWYTLHYLETKIWQELAWKEDRSPSGGMKRASAESCKPLAQPSCADLGIRTPSKGNPQMRIRVNRARRTVWFSASLPQVPRHRSKVRGMGKLHRSTSDSNFSKVKRLETGEQEPACRTCKPYSNNNLLVYKRW